MASPRYEATLEVCPACLVSSGTTPGCTTCADDYRDLELTAVATGYTPERRGVRCGYDRFPDPDEPAEFGDVTVTRSDTGAEVDMDDLPDATREALMEALYELAEDDDSDECREESRADSKEKR